MSAITAVCISNIFTFFFYISVFFLCVPGDVLHGSTGHQDPLETDGFSVGAAPFCPRRSVSPTHSFCTWLRSSLWAFSCPRPQQLPGQLCQGVCLRWRRSRLGWQRYLSLAKTERDKNKSLSCKTPSDSCSQHLDPDTPKRTSAECVWMECLDILWSTFLGGFMIKDSLFGKK